MIDYKEFLEEYLLASMAVGAMLARPPYADREFPFERQRVFEYRGDGGLVRSKTKGEKS